MTGERVLPGLGLKAFHTPGSNAWDADYDVNIRTLSAVVHLNVLDRIAAVPGSPANGDIYLITGVTNQNKIAVRDASAWVYLTPTEGWMAWVADEDTQYYFNGTTWVAFYTNAQIDAFVAAVNVTQPVLHVQDQKTLGTNGGTATAGAWQTRVLNTVVLNEIAGASLTSNQFTLPIGKFEIDAKAPIFAINGHQIRLQNITDTTTMFYGLSSYSASEGGLSMLKGKFTLAAPKVFELQHRFASTRATNGIGVAASFGTEIYSDVFVRKVG